MIGNLFRSRKRIRSERPSFKPCLESLESREVPSTAQTIAAFNALPTDMNNLIANLNARNIPGVESSINTVASDMFQLQVGASAFTTTSRLTINSALISNGIVLIFEGFNNFAFIPTQDFQNLVQLGATAARAGFTDLLVTEFFPNTSGDAVLT
ncbi:MAG TPA: hypothetical protein VE999_05370 [Gemmataceae bacterium]|nr:hypothetical protein [Gemmataceae bacterium]